MQVNLQKSTLSLLGLSRVELINAHNLFPFHSNIFDEGLKYLGFHLKLNDYKKVDWMWLTAKIEKTLKVWRFRLLSRAGRLVLIKLVLEAILVFWMVLTWIPKGVVNCVYKT